MSRSPRTYAMSPGWRLLLNDLGLDPQRMLRRAGLPADLLQRNDGGLAPEPYFALCRAMEAELEGDLALRIGQEMQAEFFDPAIFAAMCSRDLNQAATRISQYKRLICPLTFTVDVGENETVLRFRWPTTPAVPAVLARLEHAFFIGLARTATRVAVRPTRLVAPAGSPDPDAWLAWAGRAVELGPPSQCEIRFSAMDAARPFLTENESMWRFFEPELRRRLAELEAGASTAERVRASLLELLPAGDASMGVVARKLGMSSRTLQRRLKGEGTTFQALLDETREKLARHYLQRSHMPAAEISFLLGYADPNSFYRAFHAWTGSTPEQVRLGA